VDHRLGELPQRDFPLGDEERRFIPARARRRPAEADVFPVEAQMTESEPSAFALETAIVIPRSLKEAGRVQPPRTFRYSSVPGAIRRASAGPDEGGVPLQQP